MLAVQPSWKIIDSTKIKAFQECPRSYFYEYILGWRSVEPSIHLEFGKAWHYAMEHLILHGYSQQTVEEAFFLFHTHYRRFFPEHMDDAYAPKNPAYAYQALSQYIKTYANDQHKPIATEIAGTVTMDANHTLHFRMDSIREVDGQIRSLEHKTGSTLSRQWMDQWNLAVQTFVYNHVLHCLYPREQVWGIEINGVFFQKKENKFQRVPCRVHLPMMQARYWNVLDEMYRIDLEMERLLDDSDESDEVLMAFPMRPSHCTSYFGCKYMPFCMSWANPLQYTHEVPDGFHIEYWNPADEESSAKNVYHLKENSYEESRS